MRWFCVMCGIELVKWKCYMFHTCDLWAIYDTCQWGLLLVHTVVSSFLLLWHYFTVTRYSSVNCTAFCYCFSYLCVLLCEVLSLVLESIWSLCSEVFWKHCISNMYKRAQASIIITNCTVCMLLGSGSYSCFHCILQLWPRRGVWGDLSTSLWPREYHPVYGVDGRWPHSSTYTKVRYSHTPDRYVLALQGLPVARLLHILKGKLPV